MPRQPHLVVLGGPNGSGKSTTAPALLRGELGVTEFVNADAIALGLSAFAAQGVAIEAGRVMLKRLRYLAGQRVDFALESTLASRSFAPWIASLRSSGYQFHLVFLWLPSADESIARVTARVQMGGHDVPPETVRRRYAGGLRNLFHLYLPIADTWQVHDNSVPSGPQIIAAGGIGVDPIVGNSVIWGDMLRTYGHDR